MIKVDITLKPKSVSVPSVPKSLPDFMSQLQQQMKQNLIPNHFTLSYVDEEGDEIVIEDDSDYEVFVSEQEGSRLTLNLDETDYDEGYSFDFHQFFRTSPTNSNFQQQEQFNLLLQAINTSIKENIYSCLNPKKASPIQTQPVQGEIRRIADPFLKRYEELEQLLLNAQGVKEFLHSAKALEQCHGELYDQLKLHISTLSKKNVDGRRQKFQKEQKQKNKRSPYQPNIMPCQQVIKKSSSFLPVYD